MVRVLRIAVAVAVVIVGFAVQSKASVHTFSITYNGVSQIVDAGSDPIAGTSFIPGDGFNLDFHAAGNDFWQVLSASWGFIANFFVLPSSQRTGNVTSTFYLDGVQVAQDLDVNMIQAEVHIGATGTTLPVGLLFDQLIVNYSLINHIPGGTTIQGNGLHPGFSFIGNPSLAQYQVGPAAVPEPSAVVVWLLLGVVTTIGSVWMRKRA